MRGREVSVELQLDSGEVLPEVEHNGTCYVLAQVGKPFKIVVTTLKRSSLSNTRIYLTVDGVDIGYSHVIAGQRSTAFAGTLSASDAQGVGAINRFQFAPAAELPEGAPAVDLDFDVGKIVVRAMHTVPGAPARARIINNNIGSAKAPKLGDGKKWFLGPSLRATDGPVAQQQMNWNQYTWHDGPELERVSVRYETASTLVLRKILDPSRPDHQLLMGPSLRHEAELALQRAPAMAPAPRSRPTMDLTQDVPLVKPEPGIQLQLAPDEYASCDLTEEDDAAPRWQVHKKPRIDLDQ